MDRGSDEAKPVWDSDKSNVCPTCRKNEGSGPNQCNNNKVSIPNERNDDQGPWHDEWNNGMSGVDN